MIDHELKFWLHVASVVGLMELGGDFGRSLKLSFSFFLQFFYERSELPIDHPLIVFLFMAVKVRGRPTAAKHGYHVFGLDGGTGDGRESECSLTVGYKLVQE